MKVFELVLVFLFGCSAFVIGTLVERNTKGMKPSRKFDLTVKSIFSFVTFKKFYICDECQKIHRRHPNDLDVCGGWYEHKVFVGQSCAKGTVFRAHKALRKGLFRSHTDSLSLFLRNRANAVGPINDYDKELLCEASERLDELYQSYNEIHKKLYN